MNAPRDLGRWCNVRRDDVRRAKMRLPLRPLRTPVTHRITRIEAFIPTASLFAILAETAKAHNGRLVLQRFETKEHRAGLTVIAPSADAAAEHSSGGYRLIFVALRGQPTHEQDWGFFDREEENLVELAGGRQYDEHLEQVTVRPLGKKGRATKVCQEIARAIASRCSRGVMLNDTPYPKIFVANELIGRDVRLWVDIDTKTISATPAPGLGTAG